MGKSEIRWDKSITGDLPNSDELQTEIATDLVLVCKRLRLCISSCETIKVEYQENFETNLAELYPDAGAVILEKQYEDFKVNGDNGKLVDKVKDQEPDVILMCGDFLNEDSDNHTEVIKLIEKFKNIAPVYFALGNHELGYIENGHEEFLEDLETAGAVVLDKTYKDITVGKTHIRLGGLFGGDQGLVPKYIHGMYDVGAMKLFATSGLSSERQMLPRWNNRPEIAMIELSAEDN